MILNYIWISFFLIALIVALLKLFVEDVEVFSSMVNATFDTADIAFEISIGLTGVLCLWMGLMKVGERGGTIQLMSKVVGPFFNKLFPDVPADHPARGSMLMNFAANMLGLDNAATPAGLKAMKELQEINPKKDTASNAQIMFLVLNTSGLTLIPITVMNYRNTFGAENPSDVFLPILLATFFASLIGLISVAIYQKINLFNKVIVGYLGAITLIIIGMLTYFSQLSPEELSEQSSLMSNIILYGIICAFIVMAFRKKVNVYDAFIDGAKGGFEIAIKIIPFLVAILVSISVFKASGAMGYITDGLRYFFGLFMDNTDFVEGIPTALMKPLSGSGARGMMISAFKEHGVDGFVGKLVSTLQGATDTTFYIVAVYFGSVAIKHTRYAIKVGLLADLAGIIAAIAISYMFFGNSTAKTFDEPHIVVEEFTHHWSVNDTLALQYISDDCNYFDQSYDTLCASKLQLKQQLFQLQPTASSQINEVVSIVEVEDKFYVKMRLNGVLNTYILQCDKGHVTSIKLLGNFGE